MWQGTRKVELKILLWRHLSKNVFAVHAFFQLSLTLFNYFMKLQVLLWCCLIHITINIQRRNLYLAYLYPCQGLGLFMSYLCNLFFIFSIVFIIIILVHSLQLGIRDSGFGIRLRHSVFTVFQELEDFQDTQKHKSIKTKTKRKILPQTIIFSTDKAITYPKC